MLWRGKDQLIVAEWKNDDLGTSEANTDLEIISSVDNSGFRIADNGAAQREKKDYKEEFSAEINDDSPDKRTTYKATTGALVNGNRVTPCPTDKNRGNSSAIKIEPIKNNRKSAEIFQPLCNDFSTINFIFTSNLGLQRGHGILCV